MFTENDLLRPGTLTTTAARRTALKGSVLNLLKNNSLAACLVRGCGENAEYEMLEGSFLLLKPLDLDPRNAWITQVYSDLFNTLFCC